MSHGIISLEAYIHQTLEKDEKEEEVGNMGWSRGQNKRIKTGERGKPREQARILRYEEEKSRRSQGKNMIHG